MDIQPAPMVYYMGVRRRYLRPATLPALMSGSDARLGEGGGMRHRPQAGVLLLR